ncbi:MULTISPECIES: hypothetical protein [unclassified Acinetobacter]|uniref:hypothetical protein n=1 Tax=unclassified Acinetobacter TaxID=196816 RepID=UPI0021B7BFB2|nr:MULTISPECIES: hypothetical protein [unclassified Acinetobacter]MCT8090481.1 hypothetical protein [Acinetobacter sp. F_3_1]MCT8098886.1 hypothetical protein [Acinetobacter sp. C_3_1]MCT8102046.1 hypothetical protein [Acinetobacter sp. C_4_1]MCT8135854.1 hypothetical protein [Acinetobacter sp. T_3_1]
MKIEKIELELLDLDHYSDLMILPELIEDEQNIYAASTVSFFKYARNFININYIQKPDIVLEQRAIDWFGPTLLFTTAALTQNPELVSIALNVLSDYISDYFKGRKEPNIKLNVMIQKSKAEYTNLKYEGPKDGLKEIEKLIEKLKR